MALKNKDISFRYTKGQGPGGQHKNKTASCVVAKHIPTGLEVKIDGRNQHHNKRLAIKELERLFLEKEAKDKAVIKKAERDIKIHDRHRVRTYDYSRGIVTDHRTGKTASIKDIIEKGRLDRFLG
jgi:peptide chain release factor 1